MPTIVGIFLSVGLTRLLHHGSFLRTSIYENSYFQ